MSFRHGDGDWMTPDAIRKLREWWPDTSIFTAKIGARLGVSKNAIIGKAGRLDLPKRPNRNGAVDGPRERKSDKELRRLQREQYTRYVAKPRLPEVERPVEKPARVRVAAPPSPPKPVMQEKLPPLPHVVPPVAPRPVIAAPTPIPRPPPVSIPDGGGCCWPITNRPYRYCDAPTFGGLPYCEKHAGKAYQSEGWRQRGNVGEPAHASGGDD